MPRQTTRRPPVGMGRFTYWYFDVSYPLYVPEVRRAAMPKSIQASLADHDVIAGNFRAIRDGHESLGLLYDLKAAFRPELNRQVRALRYYIELDRLWQQDSAAQTLLQGLPKPKRDELLALDKKTWGRPQSWRWETLLPTIAEDQEIFREIVFLGPTDAGLSRTRPKKDESELEFVRDRHGVSEATARRIYRYYQRQMSDLMGLGVLASAGWRGGLQKAGLLNAQGRLPTKPILRSLEELSRNERKRHTEPVFHWFHHALRNLVRYRDGHPPLPFDAYACSHACRAAQRRLLP